MKYIFIILVILFGLPIVSILFCKTEYKIHKEITVSGDTVYSITSWQGVLYYQSRTKYDKLSDAKEMIRIFIIDENKHDIVESEEVK